MDGMLQGEQEYELGPEAEALQMRKGTTKVECRSGKAEAILPLKLRSDHRTSQALFLSSFRFTTNTRSTNRLKTHNEDTSSHARAHT